MIAIACDHGGFKLKGAVMNFLKENGYEYKDFGTDSEQSCDYADYAHPLAEAIERGEMERGVGICGSGEGMAITLNKHQTIRASLCWTPEIAHITRQHNDSNVLVLPARFIDNETALAILDEWLATEFEAGGRHSRRLEKIAIR